MDKTLLRELKEAGFEVGTIKDFLNLTDEDMEVVALRLMAHRLLKALRETIVERDEAKEVIGLLGKRIETMLKDGDE